MIMNGGPVYKGKVTAVTSQVRDDISSGLSLSDIESRLVSSGFSEEEAKEILADAKKPIAESMVRIDNVSKTFMANKVLEDISLDIREKDLLGIIGLSGSGKTTLLNIAIGLLQPDVGSVHFRDLKGSDYNCIYKFNKSLTQVFGFAPQDPSFYRRLTVWENLDHFGALYKVKRKVRRERIVNLLNLFELENAHNTIAGNLSGGMQRRLGMACALIHDPPIVILDEPTSDLDPIMRYEIWNYIREINNQGKTVVLTTHFLSEVEDLCTKIAILHDSRIVTEGTPDRLRRDHSKNDKISLELSKNAYDSLKRSLKEAGMPIQRMDVEGNRMIIQTPKADKVLHKIMGLTQKMNVKVVDLELNRPSLNDVFHSVVNK